LTKKSDKIIRDATLGHKSQKTEKWRDWGIMRRQILFSVLILSMVLPFFSCKTVQVVTIDSARGYRDCESSDIERNSNRTSRVFKPDEAALVVESRLAKGHLERKRNSVATIEDKGLEDTDINENMEVAYYRQEPQLVYTIQTGSFISMEYAGNQFNYLVKSLNKKGLDYLRIERIGKYNAVRLGKFDSHAAAEKFLHANKSRLSKAIILDAYIKDERIKKLYNKE
jgi:hypothetical protein